MNRFATKKFFGFHYQWKYSHCFSFQMQNGKCSSLCEMHVPKIYSFRNAGQKTIQPNLFMNKLLQINVELCILKMEKLELININALNK